MSNHTTATEQQDDGVDLEQQKPLTPEQEMAYIKEHVENAPDTYTDAIKRLMEVEMRLEDLSRAVEIAEITGQFNLVGGFRSAADESLQKKITIKREATGDMNLTVITGELDPELANKIGDQKAQAI